MATFVWCSWDVSPNSLKAQTLGPALKLGSYNDKLGSSTMDYGGLPKIWVPFLGYQHWTVAYLCLDLDIVLIDTASY